MFTMERNTTPEKDPDDKLISDFSFSWKPMHCTER